MEDIGIFGTAKDTLVKEETPYLLGDNEHGFGHEADFLQAEEILHLSDHHSERIKDSD